MKFFALKDIPNGIPAGRYFEASEDEGTVLIQVGAARATTEAETAAPDHETAASGRRHYRRRDLKAEDTDR